MMKKLLVFVLVLSTAVSMLGCGCGPTKENDTQVENTPPETTFEAIEEQVPAQPGEEVVSEEANTGNQAQGTSIGTILLQEFVNKKQENPEISAQEMADYLLSLEMIQFDGATMAVEEGLLTGFNNAEITGFSEGVMFAPMIGSIPFVGYVFTLEEGSDTDAFIQQLKDNADPRWNICTEAEETVVESADNAVFFVMCPSQFE
ncbi:MAG: hypothetical protein IKW28_07005 [Lachnospiraceae bacterium]|nr:hypothetical protein [Lachnospiraceae bacterium]